MFGQEGEIDQAYRRVINRQVLKIGLENERCGTKQRENTSRGKEEEPLLRGLGVPDSTMQLLQ